jgi:hypothetical protein
MFVGYASVTSGIEGMVMAVCFREECAYHVSSSSPYLKSP